MIKFSRKGAMRFISKAAAVIMSVLVLTSCSENALQKQSVTVYETESLYARSYVPVEAKLPPGLTHIYSAAPFGEGVLITGGSEEESPVFYTVGADLDKFRKLESDFATGASYSYCCAGDVLVIAAADENGRITISAYDSDGKLISGNELSIDTDDEDIIVSSLVSPDGANCIMGINYEKYFAVSTAGKVFGEPQISSKAGTIEQSGVNSAGEPVFAIKSDDGIQLIRVDIPGASAYTSEAAYAIDETVTGAVMGTENDGYSAYIPTVSGIYGINADNIPEMLFEYASVGINPAEVSAVCALDGGDFVIGLTNYSANRASLYLLTEHETDTKKEKETITVAVEYAGDWLSEMAVKYNISHDDSRIQVLEYSRYRSDDNPNAALDQLKLDVVSGKIPDIIDTSMLKGLGLERFGVYTDLYELMEEDGEYSRDDFLPNVLSAHEKDGKLLSIATDYMLYVYAGKKKLIGDYSEWDFDTLKALTERYPDKIVFSNYEYNCAESMFPYDYDDFIDYDSYTCSFDSEKFIKGLEFAAKYPATAPYTLESASNVRNEKALIGIARGTAPCTFMPSLREMIGSEPFAVTKAYLMRSSGFAITESCKNKQGAWDYIKLLLEYENKNVPGYHQSFSVLKTRLDDLLEASQNIPEDTENAVNISITAEEAETIRDLIYSAESDDGNVPWKLYIIINEEITRCFNGEISPEECAKILQSRVSIYLAEQQ